jgi:hypothetical protein
MRVEIDLRELCRRDVPALDQRGLTVRGKKRNLLGVGRHFARPRGDGERRTLEDRRAVLAHELFHESAGTAGIRLERPGNWFAVPQRHWRRLRNLRRCPPGRCLSERPRAEAKGRRRGGGEREEDELSSAYTVELELSGQLFGLGFRLVQEIQLVVNRHAPVL